METAIENLKISENQEKKEENIKNQEEDEDEGILSMIDTQILDDVFVNEDPQVIQQGLKKLKQFIKENKPPYQVFENLLQEYFQVEKSVDRLEKYCLCRLCDIIPLFQKSQTHALVYKCVISVVKQKSDQFQQKFDEIRQKLADPNIWKTYNLNALPQFMTEFQMKQYIQKQDIEQFIQELIAKKEFNEVILVIGAYDNEKELIYPLIHAMTKNSLASKAADYLKKFKISHTLFPELKIRLEKNCVRHYMREKQWYEIEDMFVDKPQFLGYIVEDLFFRGQKNEAYSIIKRNNLIEQNVIKKKDIQEAIEGEILIENLQLQPNLLIEQDCLNPMEEVLKVEKEGKYLNLKDFGMTEEQIIYIDFLENNENFEKAKISLINAQEIGLDTEFVPTFTKLDPPSQHKISLIQMADKNNIFLFDIYQMKTKNLDLKPLSELMQTILNGPSIKIGVGIQGDYKKMCSSSCLAIQNSVQNSLELQTLYLKEHKGVRQCSLNHIAEKLVGKPLSKSEQTSNWLRRPLRKGQIHYASMDAIVSIKILEKLREKLGDQVIQSYISDICSSTYNESDNEDSDNQIFQ